MRLRHLRHQTARAKSRTAASNAPLTGCSRDFTRLPPGTMLGRMGGLLVIASATGLELTDR